MFNGLFQPSHLLLILVVVLIVFGPGKLPEVGRAMGKTLRDMRSAFAGGDGLLSLGVLAYLFVVENFNILPSRHFDVAPVIREKKVVKYLA